MDSYRSPHNAGKSIATAIGHFAFCAGVDSTGTAKRTLPPEKDGCVRGSRVSRSIQLYHVEAFRVIGRSQSVSVRSPSLLLLGQKTVLFQPSKCHARTNR
jgi:hypothetical protein